MQTSGTPQVHGRNPPQRPEPPPRIPATGLRTRLNITRDFDESLAPSQRRGLPVSSIGAHAQTSRVCTHRRALARCACATCPGPPVIHCRDRHRRPGRRRRPCQRCEQLLRSWWLPGELFV